MMRTNAASGRLRVNRMIQDTLLKYRLRSEISQYRQMLAEATLTHDDSHQLLVDSVQKLIDSREQLLAILNDASTTNVSPSGH